ncbi:MAG TPA: response regulator [Thermoanaerobaculia bacterium]|nr:response regulator [Thermoanaerobaculia bacterium]
MNRATPPPECPVLVTEDDPTLRKLLATALRRRRLSLQTAANGQEALALLEEREWLVLILDLMMPAVSGWDVIAWMSSHPDRKPNTVIVVSAVDREMLKKLDPTVVNAIFFKPFDVFHLASYVKTACNLHHRDRRKRRLIGDEGERSITPAGH